MKKYTYQILRYTPDQVTGEFVNVGLLMFSHEHRFCRAQMIDRIGRVKHLFPQVNTHSFKSRLKSMANNIAEISEGWNEKLDVVGLKSIESVSGQLLPKDDSALQFSIPKGGVDLSFDRAFENLFQRIVLQYEDHHESTVTDREVWKKHYQRYFDQYGFKRYLHSRAVHTNGNQIEFEHAVKNGNWNYLEPVTFNLSRQTSVKEKVYKWMGKLDELDKSDEEFKLYLLTVMPESQQLRKFISERLDNKVSDNMQVELVEPETAEEVIRKLRAEL